MELSDSKCEWTVEMRDQDASPTHEMWVGRWEGGYGDIEEDGFEKSRESSKQWVKEKSRSIRRVGKQYRSEDKERSKTSHGLKDREKEEKYLDKDRVSSRHGRNEDRKKQEKEKSHGKARERDILIERSTKIKNMIKIVGERKRAKAGEGERFGYRCRTAKKQGEGKRLE